MNRFWPAILVCGAVFSSPAIDKFGNRELDDYFRAETAALSDGCLAGITNLEQWTAQRAEYRRQLQDMLGLWPPPPRTDLHPVITGRLEQPEFTVDKVQFQASPGLYVTANLYLPRTLDQPAPTILLECGHLRAITNGVSYGNKTAYQHHGAWYARNGYVCLVIDSLQLGEIQGLHPGTRNLGQWWWNARGYTPAGVEAWFGLRALDYLCSRPEVDTNRFGITGHSGGGAYSWIIAALDDRIKAAAPLAGMTDLRNHILDGVLDSHCDCNFFINTHRWDFPQVAALIAPRPLLMGGSDKDRIFWIDGLSRIHAKVRAVYALYGATDRLGLLIANGPHADMQEFQVPVFRWFNHYLKGEDPLIEMAAKPFFQPEQLRVFGQQLPADAVNTNIQAVFVPPASRLALPTGDMERQRRREQRLYELRAGCFAGWPVDSGPPVLSPVVEINRGGLVAAGYQVPTQAHAHGRLFVSRPARTRRPARVILTVLDADTWPAFADRWPIAVTGAGIAPDADRRIQELRREMDGENVALAFYAPRGIGPDGWTTNAVKQSQIRRRFMLLGQTLDGMRVYDIRRAIQALRTLPELQNASLELRGDGDMGVNALYASLFEPGVARLQLRAVPASHLEGPDYLGVLKVWDIPQALDAARDCSTVDLQ